MPKIDCVIVGNNTGDFQQYIRDRKLMDGWSGAYRDAKINSVLVDGQRISYMELFNQVRKGANPNAEALSAFDPLGLAGLHLASFLARHGTTIELVGEFQKGRERIEQLLSGEPLALAITTTFY